MCRRLARYELTDGVMIKGGGLLKKLRSSPYFKNIFKPAITLQQIMGMQKNGHTLFAQKLNNSFREGHVFPSQTTMTRVTNRSKMCRQYPPTDDREDLCHKQVVKGHVFIVPRELHIPPAPPTAALFLC